jgi:hypothetical protein
MLIQWFISGLTAVHNYAPVGDGMDLGRITLVILCDCQAGCCERRQGVAFALGFLPRDALG